MARTAASGRVSVQNFQYSLNVAGGTNGVNWGNILLSNTAVTASCWVNFRSNSGSFYDVFFGYMGTGRWYLIREGNANRIYFAFRSGGAEKGTGISGPQLDLNTWYLAIGTHDPSGGANNTTIRVYDQFGTLIHSASATNAFSLDSTTRPLFIGRDSDRGTSVTANYDECRIYSRALTVAEQNNLAKRITISRTGLIGFWKFNEGSGTSALDSSGNGNTGTITGATYSSTNIVDSGRSTAVGRTTLSS